MIKLKTSKGFGRFIRADDYASLGRATYHGLIASLKTGDWERATQLAQYFLHELRTVRKIYTDWCRDMMRWFRERHGQDDEASLIQCTTSPWYGERFQPVVGLEAAVLFRRLLDDDSAGSILAPAASGLLTSLERRDREAALWRAEEVRACSQLYQDIYTDWCWSIMTYVSRTYGEEEVARLIRDTVLPWYKERYDHYFALSDEERLQLTVEGMRGHLSGPGRFGDVEVADEGNRWVISFNPCGSGGRMRRGDPSRGDPPRTDLPYSFGVSSRPYDWTWKRAGVCYYCAHCAIVNEQLAIDIYGHPIRITEYPQDPDQPCRWIIYKNVDDIPEEYYARVGRKKPRQESR